METIMADGSVKTYIKDTQISISGNFYVRVANAYAFNTIYFFQKKKQQQQLQNPPKQPPPPNILLWIDMYAA